MPARLLALLTDAPQSGDALGERLGVNRVTINTLAKRLLDDGVPIVTTRAGYALAPGTPAPALLHTSRALRDLNTVRYVGTVTSTQDEVRAWADDPVSPAPHGAVVVAERQTAGRGRRGRPWDTTHGTLVLSVLLRGEGDGYTLPPLSLTPLTLTDLALLPLAVGVAVHAACGVGGLKWPNDLLAPDGRKLAGILMEADLRGEEARRAIIGIGVNVSSAPSGAAHLTEFRPGLTRAGVLDDLLTHLETWLSAPPQDVRQAWQAASYTLGRTVRIETPRGTVEGTATALDPQGSLIVQTASGLHTISAGDVQLVGELGHRNGRSGGPSP